LSSRSISVPIKEGDPGRYNIYAVIVETSVKEAAQLRERFYQLKHPKEAHKDHPYTGSYQFVPMLKSKQWPVEKIYQLAQLHVSIMDHLRPLYIQNIQDINNVIVPNGDSLLQVFLRLPVTCREQSLDPANLLHSIHNTRQPER
jgi:hypothetical protein